MIKKMLSVIVAASIPAAALAQDNKELPVEGRVEINMLLGYNTNTGLFDERFVSHSDRILSAKYLYIVADQAANFGACFRGDPVKAGELFKKMVVKMNRNGDGTATGIRINIGNNSENNTPMLKISAVDESVQRYDWFPRMRQCKSLVDK